jgi:hypothetical protein
MRRPLDFYETPLSFTRALLDNIETDVYGTVLEPCNGDGAISNELRINGFKVKTNDIDSSRESDYHYDATKKTLWKKKPSWTITNPPFSSAHKIIPLAYEWSRHGVACLLRLTYLEPCRNRADFLAQYPPAIIVLPRFSFTRNGGTDTVTCAWFIWNKEYIRRPKVNNFQSQVTVVTREKLSKYESP